MSGRISVGLSVRSRRRRTAPHEASRCASEHAGVDRQPERRGGAGFRRAREAVPVLAGGEPGGTQRDHLRAGRHPKVASLPAFFGLVLALLALAAPATLEAQAALETLRLAADQGDTSAQYNLGFAYGDGLGVPQDAAEAVRWYRLAAEQGHASAQNNLGFAYGDGLGVGSVAIIV